MLRRARLSVMHPARAARTSLGAWCDLHSPLPLPGMFVGRRGALRDSVHRLVAEDGEAAAPRGSSTASTSLAAPALRAAPPSAQASPSPSSATTTAPFFSNPALQSSATQAGPSSSPHTRSTSTDAAPIDAPVSDSRWSSGSRQGAGLPPGVSEEDVCGDCGTISRPESMYCEECGGLLPRL